MAHIHLEDGSFTLFWVLAWWIVALILLGVSLVWVRQIKKINNRQLTLAAFCTAAAFVIFQVSIPFLGGVHISLTPLIGILLGPAIGALVILIINILSAAIGHGGWGLIGANLIINIIELTVAYGVWRGLRTVFPGGFARAGIATLAGLFCGNVAMITIIVVSGIQGTAQTSSQVLAGLFLLAGINMGVAVIEAFITGLIIASIMKARPDMLDTK